MFSRQLSGSWIPWLFVAGFAVVLVANATLIWVAVVSWPGLVAENSYERGLHYNRRFEQAAAQAALGWRVDYSVRLAEGREVIIEAAITDPMGQPLEDARIEALFWRPTHTGFDFALALTPQGQGRYAASFPLPLPGLWDVRLRVLHGADRWVGEKRFFLR